MRSEKTTISNLISSSLGPSGFRASQGNNNQSKSNNNQCKCNQGLDIYIPKTKDHNISFFSLYARNKESIPASTSAVNTTILKDESIPGNPGPTSAKPNQNTEKFIKKSAMTESKLKSFILITRYQSSTGSTYLSS